MKLYKFMSLLTVQAATLAVCLFTATIASAAIYFVATNGSDSNPGTLAQPFRTIGKGTSSLKSGDTLYLRGGTYDAIIGGYDVPGGSPGQHTVIAGYDGEKPIIRCTNCGILVVTLFNSYITLEDFTIDLINGESDSTCAYLSANTLFQRMTCLNAGRDGVRVVGENTTIRDSHIKDCGRIQTQPQDTKGAGIHANSDGESNTSNLLIEGNLIEGCRAGGIGVHQEGKTRNVTVRNNIIRNFGTKSTWPQQAGMSSQYGTGITFGHGSYYYAYNNVIYNAGKASGGYRNQCFLTWGGGLGRPHGSFYYIYNNTCHDGDVGIEMWDQSNNVTAKNNIFSSMGQAATLGNGANNTNTNYVTNPNFVNPAAGDFHLKPGSPGIGEGANLSSTFTTDMDGVARGSSFDIGAYQYAATGGVSITRPTSPVNLQVSR